ncbi:hypothetical protein WISP_37751 [Willisornis vidua]|uniref:Uncharacterized protein n=1 Tax=Willisornis vidua TaxID=1566151 RepID=A0ABQ9DHX0_9PASS|nr:hypothetical protein WISP_37751 [Willisornis vidua]
MNELFGSSGQEKQLILLPQSIGSVIVFQGFDEAGDSRQMGSALLRPHPSARLMPRTTLEQPPEDPRSEFADKPCVNVPAPLGPLL